MPDEGLIKMLEELEGTVVELRHRVESGLVQASYEEIEYLHSQLRAISCRINYLEAKALRAPPDEPETFVSSMSTSKGDTE